MGCGTTTLKISWILINIVFGILSIGCMIYMANSPDAPSAEYFTIGYIVSAIVLACCILFCFAGIRESVPLLLVGAIFYLLLGIAHITIASLSANNGDITNGLEVVNKAWNNNQMDALQREYECCGKDSAQDYILYNKPIPASCYRDEHDANLDGLYLTGCSVKLRYYHDVKAKYFLIGLGAVILLQVIGFLLGLVLAINLRNKQRRMRF